MIHRRAVCAGLVLIISGCATFTAIDFEQKFGAAAPRERVVNAVKPGDQDYWQDVKPVLEQRCVVCHACYDAPCQLKLSSIEGIERGASPVCSTPICRRG